MHGKRIQIAVRNQMQWRDGSLDQLLPPEHSVRAVWNFVCSLNLEPFFSRIQVTDTTVGNNAFDPRTLITLWLQATLDGVGTGRELARRCEFHLVYQWICGGVAINYHTLNDFRVQNDDLLDNLLTETVATLCHAGVASLDRVAQDGMRVRAGAGSSSFHREKTLKEHLDEAQQQVEILKAERDDDPGASQRRCEAAKLRAAEDRVQRLESSLNELATLKAENAQRAPSRQKPESELRVSSTDPEARKMKMGDGGFRPAFNVQFSTTTQGGVIVGVDVVNEGTDAEQMDPMHKQFKKRYNRYPKQTLVDNGFATLEQIEAAATLGIEVLAPLKEEQKQLDEGGDPYAKKKGDGPGVAAWRARMGTESGKVIYKERGQTAEWPNAMARNRGMNQFRVRGLSKVRAVTRWFALAHNLSRGMSKGLWRP